MPSEVPDDAKQQIAEAIFAERKIEAIKLYRQATGQGLAEAKEFIEKLTEELREKSPEKFKPLSSGSAAGCGSSALIFLMVISALAVCATTIIG
jgi:hypothetical protein